MIPLAAHQPAGSEQSAREEKTVPMRSICGEDLHERKLSNRWEAVPRVLDSVERPHRICGGRESQGATEESDWTRSNAARATDP
ncbi:MAG: hypothetical protein AAF412_08100, partial [Pseudomonadota bacterium]